MQQVIISATSHACLNRKRFEQVYIPIHQNYSKTSDVWVKLCEKKPFQRKMSFLEPVYQRHAVRFQSTKSDMRPTFQNIDYFKDETGSIIGMLTSSTVNPENFSL